MINIIAQRGNADRPGPDISDPLITSIEVAKERGRVELDSHERQTPVTITTRFNPAMVCGKLVRVVDAALGPVWPGKITSVEHVGVDGGIVTKLELSRSE